MRLVWTRPLGARDQALLESLGLEFLVLPLIRTEYLDLSDHQLAALAALHDPIYLFTSRHGVDSLWRWPMMRPSLLAQPAGTVGAATARHCESLGIKVFSGSENFGAKDLEGRIVADIGTNRQIVCPGPVIRAYPLAERLSLAGFPVHSIDTYETKSVLLDKPVPSDDDDIVAFCSPSAVASFFDVNVRKTRALLASKFLALGEQVASDLRARGSEEVIVIKELSKNELERALAR